MFLEDLHDAGEHPGDQQVDQAAESYNEYADELKRPSDA